MTPEDIRKFACDLVLQCDADQPLKTLVLDEVITNFTIKCLNQAANEIERLQRDVTGYMEICNQQITTVEKLRETLRPFAKKYNITRSRVHQIVNAKN